MTNAAPSRSKLRVDAAWILGAGLVYVLLCRPVMTWSGQWPSPYWFSAGVAVLLAYGLTSNKSAHLIWAIPAACIAVLTAWFFSAGVYQDWFPFDLRRYFRYYWAQRVPVVLLISLVVGLLMSGSIKVRWLSSTLFAVVFLLALIVGEPLCSLSLPHVGTFAHGDYDTLGYRLGGYFLVATTLCLVPLQYFLFRPSHAQNEKSV